MDEKKAMLTVTINDKCYEYPKGTPLEDLARAFQAAYDHDIVLVKVNGIVKELHEVLEDAGVLQFMTTADPVGHRAYKRSGSMLFMAALRDVAGDAVSRVINHFSVGYGFYYSVAGVEVTDELVAKVEERMKALAAEGLPIRKTFIRTEQAIALFESLHQPDKADLFRTRLASRVHIYELNGYEDYYYGVMLHNTSFLKAFKLYHYRDGIVLQLPPIETPEAVTPLDVQEKLFDAQMDGEKQSDILGIPNIGALNQAVVGRDTRELILMAEAVQESRIAELAQSIIARGTVKFVMIAGPSSSGKTTFSQRLCIQLMSRGYKPHYIGLDNYFVNRADTPLLPNGQKDFESLRAIDVAGFNRDMAALLQGETVEMPYYDFIKGERVYRGDFLTLGDEDLLVIEGIHGLNEKMSESLPSESKYKVYISALTQLNVDDHNRIRSNDGRLIRRIIRDNRTRGHNASQTIAMWPAVRKGEENNIFPFEESADFIFNSALPYELAVLKQYVQPLLFGVPVEDPSYTEARRLLKFLDYFIGLPEVDVPTNSILREFIGGGCFHL
ncbi:MAG: nucleoside kinase [Lachnospiraceae bacterium]|nr:nucleoside kinase [Lachnospiraceae bacterium]